MRRLFLLTLDVAIFGASAFVALLLRENFESTWARMGDVVPFALVLAAIAAVMIVLSGLDRSVWRFSSSAELPRIMSVVTVSLLVALFATFGLNRLQGVSRSLPFIQWCLIVGGMLTARFVARTRMLRRHRRAQQDAGGEAAPAASSVLVLGLNEVASLYLRSVGEYAVGAVRVAGLLARNEKHCGRLVQLHKVLGTYADLGNVLQQLEVHGVFVDRIVVAEPFDRLDPGTRSELLELEKSGRIRLDLIVESLGLISPAARLGPLPWSAPSPQPAATLATLTTAMSPRAAQGQPSRRGGHPMRDPLGRSAYVFVKRALDIVCATALLVAALPLLVLVTLLVARDVGFPVLFWQLRSGQGGRLIKIWKFRTMRSAIGAAGGRIPDDERLSRFGRWLRRTRLDELPQLIGVIRGDMSFIGPRPVLPADLPEPNHPRFSMRPGLTGWAQVHGGRDVTVQERAALDGWYVRNASLQIDLGIALATVRMIVKGDRRNEDIIAQAMSDVARRSAAGQRAKPTSDVVLAGARAG